ncbi:MAG: sensor histidine kinase, partial [Intestinibacter sp.]
TLKMTEDLDGDTKNRFLGIIENETTRLSRLIDDILLLSTVENKVKKKVEKVDLFEIFEEVHEIVGYIAKNKNIKIDYQFENEDLDLWEYSGYIRQILLNIIENAIKYTGQNGKVNVRQYAKQDKVFIEIQDNGIGIPKADLDRVFERFYRVDKARSRSVGGTGLGLAITKHMVLALNGNIKVESELGVGSKFTIELPFNREFSKNVS